MSGRGEEELRFDPAIKTWELFESVVGAPALRLPWSNAGMCELNGVLYCADVNFKKAIIGSNEVTRALKELKLENRGLWPNQLLETRKVGNYGVAISNCILGDEDGNIMCGS